MRIILSLILLVISGFEVNCQIAGVGNAFSLDACIETALKNNFDIKLADARTESAGADITSAFGNFLPSINLNSGYTRQLNAKSSFGWVDGQLVPTDPTPNSYNVNAGAQWLIFDGFARGNNYIRAHESFNAYDLNAKHIRQRIKVQVVQNYIEVIAKYQIVKIRRENLDLGKKELERIKAQNKAGVISIDIVYNQEAELGNKEYELVSAENDLNISKANLLIIMGLSPDKQAEFLESSLPVNIKNDEISEFRNIVGPFREAINESLNSRLDYLALKSSLKAAESSLEGSYSGFYPSISASGGWGWSNSKLENFSDFGRSSIGLNFYLPIFDQFNTNYRIQTAKLQVEQVKIEQEQLEQNIKSAIQTSFLNLDAAEKKLDISERALHAANMNNESMKEKFRVGTVSITDYLIANNQFITAQINRINAVYQYYRTQKEILYSIGKLN